MDYYGIIRNPRNYGIPAVIVEHAYIDNQLDYNEFLSTDDKLKQLGIQDATAIAEFYGLTLKEKPYEAVYNYDYYVAANPDVTAVVGTKRSDVFKHFVDYGMAEGRRANEVFDVRSYYNEYPDLRRQFGDNLSAYYQHYITYGKAEGRHGTGCSELVSAGPIPMYRLYNPNSGEHFYTKAIGERDSLVRSGWRAEGIGWYAPEKSASTVYRLYNPHAGDHHYTMSTKERDSLVRVGWKYEGVGWYSDYAKGVPLFRQYNPNAVSGTHNYTVSKAENNHLVGLGWRAEGIAWYGVKR